MKSKYTLYAVVTVGLLVLGYFLFFYKGNEAKAESKSGGNNPVKVEAVVLTPQKTADTLSLSGTIDADEKIDVRSEVSGIVEKIYFSEGAQVAQGQTLFKINDVELQAQLVTAETKHQLTAENERRARLLLDKGAISQEEYDLASADYKTAQAQIQLIKAQISKTLVRAPFAGIVGLRNISQGAYVSPDMILTTLVKNNQVKLTFSIPEKYVNIVKNNSVVHFTVANSSEDFTAKIYALQPEIEVSTRTLTVRALADNSAGKLFPGTFANIAFNLNAIDNALKVPTEAIVPVQDGKKVFVYKNGKAKEVMVQTGSRDQSDIVITDGLKVNDTVITSGVLSLKDNANVQITIKK